MGKNKTPHPPASQVPPSPQRGEGRGEGATVARRLRRNQTTAEQRLWARLRDHQLEGHKFKCQVPRGSFIVDFACLERKLIVELDGGQHAEPLRNEKDRKRSLWLEGQGYRVLRFWNNEVLENMDGVLLTIIEALNDSPHPDPLPKGEREQQQDPRPACGEREGPQKHVGKREGEGKQRAQAKPTRRHPTDAELRLWSAIRRRQLDGLRFRRQVPLGAFIVDFACYDARLVIELDGGQHAEQSEADTVRTQWFESRGFQVLRFLHNEVLENMDGVVATIVAMLRDRVPPPPDPLPAGEREPQLKSLAPSGRGRGPRSGRVRGRRQD
jgi:very-short-patch-repair endonuclease